MSRACRTPDRREMDTKLGSENLMRRDQLQNLGVDWRIILVWILEKLEWIHLPQDRDLWRALVNMVP
jgi:hypothetical protein